MRYIHSFLTAIFFLLCLNQVHAIDLKSPAATAMPNTSATGQQVQAELLIHAPDGIAPNKTFFLGVKLNHQPGWHTYWLNPGDTGLPTTLNWKLPAGMTVGSIHWPLPKKISVGDFTNYGFEGETLLVVPVKVAPTAPRLNEYAVQLQAHWLACETACIPEEALIQTHLQTQVQTRYQSQFESVFNQQPKRGGIPFKAKWHEQQLSISITGLPKDWQDKSVEAYPMTNEVLASAMERNGSAAWQNQAWEMKAQLHEMNIDPVQTLPMVLINRSHSSPQAIEVLLQIEGAWPAHPTSLTQASERREPPPFNPQNQAIDGWQIVTACLGALLGGLILNLMPCVLPVLSIKALGLTQQAMEARERRLQGLAFALGTIGFLTLIGFTLIGLRSVGIELGWGFQLQSPWTLLGLLVLFTLLALNLWGVFEWPSISVSTQGASTQSLSFWRSFGAGALTVIVATPCTAPFMGASLGLAMVLPAWSALPIFMSLGIGLALPLTLLSWLPNLGHRLPKPGQWMIRLKQGLGFPMLATVIWLLWVLNQQTNAHVTALTSLLLLSLAATLATSPLTRYWRWIWRTPTLAVIVICLVYLISEINRQASRPPISMDIHSQRPDSSNHGTQWQEWSPQAVEQARAENKPVFIDFTAAWCITCQFNEKVVLSRADVKQAFIDKKVHLFKADWTKQDPRITLALKQLGRSGVPVYVLYAPASKGHLFSELLNAEDLLSALNALPNSPSDL